MADDLNVQVAVRIRPLLEKEIVEAADVCCQPVHDGSSQLVMGKDRMFTFDKVYDQDVPQEPVFDKSVVPLLDACFSGYNATVLAYGQTGSGKTYTMGSGSIANTVEEQVGIIPRVITDMFCRMQKLKDTVPGAEFRVKAQFIEIYGETIVDLLDPAPDCSLPIRENEDGSIHLVGVTEEEVSSAHQLMQCLERGSLSRTTAGTLMNAHSSRSHAIFSVILEQNLPEQTEAEEKTEAAGEGEEKSDAAAAQGGEATTEQAGESSDSSKPATEIVTEKRTSKFHFVDLAGSERAKRTQAVGQRLKEGIQINKGLLALGNVISALGDVRKRGKVHVPYRDSKLTRMLQDSLGGNSKTLMIACVSPASTNFDETLNALKYANRARNIKNKPIVNRDRNASRIAALKQEIAMLKRKVQGGTGMDNDMLRSQLRSADAETQRMSAINKQLRRALDKRTEDKLAAMAKLEQLAVLYAKETGKQPPAELCSPAAGAAVDTSSVELDDEATRDVSAGIPAEVIRKYLGRIQALQDSLEATKKELAEAQSTIETNFIDLNDEDFSGDAEQVLSRARDEPTMLPDLIARVSFGSHNSPCVKMARANLLSHRSPAGITATARIIAETKRKAVEMSGIVDSEEMEATNKAIAEAEEQFTIQHGQMVKTVQTLNDDIRSKESSLRSHSKFIDKMKKFYETKMAKMEHKIQRTQQERQRLQTEIQNIGSTVEVEKRKLKEALLKKLRATEAKLAEMKRKQREHDKAKVLQSRAMKRLNEARAQLERMKSARVQQMRAMDLAKKKFRADVLLKSREILSLRREAQKDRTKLRKLQFQGEKKTSVLKKRVEGLAAQNRRLKEAQKRNRRIRETAQRTAAMAARAQSHVSKPGTSKWRRRTGSEAAKIQKKLQDAIKAVAEKERKNEELRQKLQKRDEDLRAMQDLLGQHDSMVVDLGGEIDSFFGAEGPTAAAGGAGVGAGAGTLPTLRSSDEPSSPRAAAAAAAADAKAALSTPERKSTQELAEILVPQRVSSGVVITEEEAEALEELEERIESLEARLQYNNSLVEKQLKEAEGEEGEEGDDSADQAEASIGRVSSLEEAKGVMSVLFDMVLDSKKLERTMSTQLQDVKLRLAEAKAELGETLKTMSLQKELHERALNKARAEHAQEQALLFSVAGNGPDDDDDEDDEDDDDDDEVEDEEVAAAEAGAAAKGTPSRAPRIVKRVKAENVMLNDRNAALHEQLQKVKKQLASMQSSSSSSHHRGMPPKRRRSESSEGSRRRSQEQDDGIWKPAEGESSSSHGHGHGHSSRRSVGSLSRASRSKPKPRRKLPGARRLSLGGRTAGVLQRPSTAPAPAAAPAAATAEAADDDEFGDEEFSSSKDVLSKPMALDNVFARLSHHSNFTGTQKQTHNTIALGKIEYRADKNNMFRRTAGRPRKKAWQNNLRSSSGDSKRPATAPSSSTAAPPTAEVFNRLASSSNFTGIHKQRHEELLKKKTHGPSSKHGKRRGSGSKPPTGSSATSSSTASSGTSAAAAAAPADSRPATPPRGGKLVNGSPIRLEGGKEARVDALGIDRLLDAVAGNDASLEHMLSPHLDVETKGKHSQRKMRTRSATRKGRALSYSPTRAPAAAELSTVVEEEESSAAPGAEAADEAAAAPFNLSEEMLAELVDVDDIRGAFPAVGTSSSSASGTATPADGVLNTSDEVANAAPAVSPVKKAARKKAASSSSSSRKASGAARFVQVVKSEEQQTGKENEAVV